eukprot:4518023-Pleurochrysis_carterae.AAC.1
MAPARTDGANAIGLLWANCFERAVQGAACSVGPAISGWACAGGLLCGLLCDACAPHLEADAHEDAASSRSRGHRVNDVVVGEGVGPVRLGEHQQRRDEADCASRARRSRRFGRFGRVSRFSSFGFFSRAATIRRESLAAAQRNTLRVSTNSKCAGGWYHDCVREAVSSFARSARASARQRAFMPHARRHACPCPWSCVPMPA